MAPHAKPDATCAPPTSPPAGQRGAGASSCRGCALAVTPLQAQTPVEDWVPVHREPGRSIHLGAHPARTPGGLLRYRVLVNFDYGARFDGARPYKSALLVRLAQCDTRAQDTQAVLQYDAPWGQGELVWEMSFDDATLRLEPVEPGSLSALLLDVACASRP